MVRSARVRSETCANTCSHSHRAVLGVVGRGPSMGVILSIRQSTVRRDSNAHVGPAAAMGNEGTTRVVVVTNYRSNGIASFPA